mgnify:CR=1 FL=1
MSAAEKLNGEILSSLLVLVKKHTGITMEARKRELLFSRINRRIRALGLNTPEQYIAYLQDHEDEVQMFVNAVTTNETLFFRTPVIWDYFTKEFLPAWHRKHLEEPLRVWSAASSSGEEAYSIAMVCAEFKEKNPAFKFQISGSDISTDVLNKARSGVFKEKTTLELKAKSPDLYYKYFLRLPNGEHKFKDHLTGSPEFFVHNLHTLGSKIQHFDIVFLRNVLIYFNDKDQELVLNNIHRATKPGGMLILGESESLARLKTSFVFHKPLIYSKG